MVTYSEPPWSIIIGREVLDWLSNHSLLKRVSTHLSQLMVLRSDITHCATS